MKKELFSLLLCTAIMTSLVPTAKAGFSDVSDSETSLAAATLQGLGIVSGVSDTSFSPDTQLTRGQVCAMLVRMLGLSNQVNAYAKKTLFSDVAPSDWYNGAVNLAASRGLVNGYGNGRFGPNDPVTYGQLSTMMLRLLGYTTADIGSIWPQDYTDFADELELCGGLNLTPDQTLTRGQAAIILSNTLRAEKDGKSYFYSMDSLSSTQEAILLEVDADYGNGEHLLKVYPLDGSNEVVYYTQKNQQSDTLCGTVGTLLFHASGSVLGFVPDSTDYLDVTLSSATATKLTTADSLSYRIASQAKVIAGGEVYPYATTGYQQLNQASGKTVRLFYDNNGAISYLYLTGGTADSSEAVLAGSRTLSALVSQLGIGDASYTITKNGSQTDASALAAQDVAYYDSTSHTLRLSDWRVSGYLESASPSVGSADTLTVAGASFSVLDCAKDSLASYRIGSKVTLHLTDDGKVASVSSGNTAQMLGILAENGRSVTLIGSGITLQAADMVYDKDCLGSLVSVNASDTSTLTCKSVSGGASGTLSIPEERLGSKALSASCAIYEWAGSGYLYSLEGEKGVASHDLSAITWTDTLASSSISYAHENSAGEIDLLVLKNVTGNSYQYGKGKAYTGSEGISIVNGERSSTNNALTLTNSSGVSSKYLCAYSLSGQYTGIALGQSSSGAACVTSLQTLSRHSAAAEDFYVRDGAWYVRVDDTVYPVSDAVEIHLVTADVWESGEDALQAVLADGYSLTLYCDRSPEKGGQVRILVANNA